jgi:hypothetical protein
VLPNQPNQKGKVMSHTSTIKSVPIRDLSAFRQALTELETNRGIKTSIVENVKPKLYFSHQSDTVGVLPYVVKIEGCPYDIGLKQNEDNSYDIVTDIYNDSVRNKVGTPQSCRLQATEEEKAVGMLMQEYAKFATINTAVSQGYMVESCVIDESGEVQLTLAV